MNFSKLQIGDVIKESAESFALNENIQWSITVESGYPAVPGDASQLIRVIQNLVSNAQDAMARGGSLTITAQGTIMGIEIEISDMGSGIGPENIDRIFEPLFTDKCKGTGLGLAISQEIISNHDGSISVRRQIGIGTSFTVCLPFAVQDDCDEDRRALG